MFKITYCMRRLPNLSRQEFQDYYRKVHTRSLTPQDVAWLGMRRYVQLHAYSSEECAEVDDGRGGEESFDAIAEIWLDDQEAFRTRWLSAKGQEIMRRSMEDEERFIDWTRSVHTCSRELVFMDGPSTPARTKAS